MKLADKNKYNFVVKHHKGITKHGLGAQASTKAFKTTSMHGMKTALVPKKYLGVNTEYQRPLKDEKVSKIKATFSEDIYDLASVFHIKIGKDNYYQVTNGQHRVCAYPKDEVPCRIVNTLAPCTRFLQANDPRSVSPLKRDEIFWGKVYEVKTTKNGDPDGVLKAIHAFKKFGYKPTRDIKGERDFGAKVSTIHHFWNVYTKTNYKQLNLSSTALRRKSLDTLEDTLEIITEVFGVNAFSRSMYHGLLWGAMLDWLSNKDYMNGRYNVKDVITTLKKGSWSMNHRCTARKKKLLTIDDWKEAVVEYQVHINRRHDEWRSLIDDVFAVSSKV